MAAGQVNLPPGFELEQTGIPAGFEPEVPVRRTPLQMIVQDAIAGKIRGGLMGGILGGASAIGREASRAMEEGAYEAGGRVTEAATRAGLPTPVAAGAGFGTNVALQAIPALAMGGTGGAAAGKVASVPLQGIARSLMGSALKPTLKMWKSGDAATAIDTMLEKGINVTEKGVEQLRGHIDTLNNQIKDAIASSKETVAKSDVAKDLTQKLNEFKKQVNPDADIAAIKKAWEGFKNHPLLSGMTDIPVQLAQELKQGTYRQLSKKYGQLGSAEEEAQKTMARTLKEKIAEKVPGIAGLNAEESQLIKTLGVAERRVLMDLNKNPGGLSWLAHNPATWAAFMADKSAPFKSLLARALYRADPAMTGLGEAGGVSLYELGRQGRQQ